LFADVQRRGLQEAADAVIVTQWDVVTVTAAERRSPASIVPIRHIGTMSCKVFPPQTSHSGLLTGPIFLFLARISALSAGWGCRERKCAEIYNTQHNKFILFKIFAISISVISHRNSFRVLFDNIASAYFISKIYLYFATENGQPRNQH